jgi:hypothetical protein
MALADTKTLRNILSASKSMMGDGMAWLVKADNIKNVLKSFLNIPEMARTYFIFVGTSTFPTEQYSKIPDEQLEENLQQWEKQFGLVPAVTSTLQERAIAVEAQWSLTGSLGIKYFQKILNDSGIPVFLRENIPPVDYSNDLNSISYGSTDYKKFLSVEGYDVNYNTGAGSFLLGNGFLTTQAGDVEDIVNTPSTLPQWQAVILVEGAVFGSTVTLTAQQYNLFLELFLRYKRMDSIGLCRITVN